MTAAAFAQYSVTFQPKSSPKLKPYCIFNSILLIALVAQSYDLSPKLFTRLFEFHKCWKGLLVFTKKGKYLINFLSTSTIAIFTRKFQTYVAVKQCANPFMYLVSEVLRSKCYLSSKVKIQATQYLKCKYSLFKLFFFLLHR